MQEIGGRRRGDAPRLSPVIWRPHPQPPRMRLCWSIARRPPRGMRANQLQLRRPKPTSLLLNATFRSMWRKRLAGIVVAPAAFPVYPVLQCLEEPPGWPSDRIGDWARAWSPGADSPALADASGRRRHADQPRSILSGILCPRPRTLRAGPRTDGLLANRPGVCGCEARVRKPRQRLCLARRS